MRLGFRFEGTDGSERGQESRFKLPLFEWRDPDRSGGWRIGIHEESGEVSTGTKSKAGMGSDRRRKTVIHSGFGIYHALLDTLDYRLTRQRPITPR